MGQCAGAGESGKARGEAGFDQARRPLIRILHHVRNCAAGRGKKRPPVRDSLVPPMVDFGYAGARQLIRVRAYSALDQETMP
jgi:hypothetical protein